MELAESSRQHQKSSGIPWNILVVPRQDFNNKAVFRKCCSKYAKHHRRDYFHRSIFSRMEAIQKTSNYETLKYRNTHCFNLEMRIHKNNIAEVHKCMKKSLGNRLANQILEDVKPGIMRKVQPKCLKRTLFKTITNPIARTITDFVRHLLAVFLSYLDFLKDLTLLGTLITTVGGLHYVVINFTNLQAQIIVSWACTLAMPLLANTAYFLTNSVHAIGLEGTASNYSKCQMCFIYMIVFCTSAILPSVLMFRKRCGNAKIDSLAEKAKHLEEAIDERNTRIDLVQEENENLIRNNPGGENNDLVEENKQIVIGLEAQNQLKKNEIEDIVTQSQVIEKENKKLRESILTTKLNESSLETVFQTAIQLSLLLLNLTESPTYSIFSAIFDEDEGILFLTTEMVLAFSIIVSIKTCVLSGSKLVSFGKEGFLPTVGKILLILSSLASILARIGSLILFFGPSFGLLA